MSLTYAEILDEVYQSYLAVKPEVLGRPDRETRDPRTILGLAEDLGLLPLPRSVISITGSKGKGTVSRTIAALLQKRDPDRKVGLLVSPHERDHTDRMRVQSLPISTAEFCEVYEKLRPSLQKRGHSLRPPAYLSPSGTFLLMALWWFRECGVRRFVLEAGRGAEFDEVGCLSSAVSVVTSILMEHPEYLGPRLEDIARSKLAIGRRAAFAVLDSSAGELNRQLGVLKENFELVEFPESGSGDAPRWIEYDWRLACRAVSRFEGGDVASLEENRQECLRSASFFKRNLGGVSIYVEGAISRESIDFDFVDRLVGRYPSLQVLTSLPNDKELHPIVESFSRIGKKPKHILVKSASYLDYSDTRRGFPEDVLGEVQSDAAPSEVEALLKEAIRDSGAEAIYALGTQSFVRVLRDVGVS